MCTVALMTEGEIHIFGINTVLDFIRKDNYVIELVNTDPALNPQIVARKNGKLSFIFVRTACYPYKGRLESLSFAIQALQRAKLKGADCFFASVGIANADGTTDLEMGIPVKGAGYYIAYDGLIKLTSQMIASDDVLNLQNNSYTVFDQGGSISGKVVRHSDGRHTLMAGEKSDFNFVAMSNFLVFANVFADVAPQDDKKIFSKWANLPENNWLPRHTEMFALGLMHYVMELKTSGENVPLRLKGLIVYLQPQALARLPRPLTNEIRNIFLKLFDAE